jgi:hypothetical protein
LEATRSGDGTDLGIEASAEAFQEWMGETEHPAFALGVEFSRRGVVEDAQVVAAAQLEAVDEFLAQYEG